MRANGQLRHMLGKWRNSVHILTEIYNQRSKWLEPWCFKKHSSHVDMMKPLSSSHLFFGAEQLIKWPEFEIIQFFREINFHDFREIDFTEKLIVSFSNFFSILVIWSNILSSALVKCKSNENKMPKYILGIIFVERFLLFQLSLYKFEIWWKCVIVYNFDNKDWRK